MIRKATQADVPRIVEMVGHFINQTGYSAWLRFMPSAMTPFTSRTIEIGIIFVAEEDGRLVGFIAGQPFEEPFSRQRQLDELAWWVEPSARSKLIGPKMLRSFENWGRQKGLQLCKMIAPSGSSVGTFYERLGYQAVETSYLKRL